MIKIRCRKVTTFSDFYHKEAIVDSLQKDVNPKKYVVYSNYLKQLFCTRSEDTAMAYIRGDNSIWQCYILDNGHYRPASIGYVNTGGIWQERHIIPN